MGQHSRDHTRPTRARNALISLPSVQVTPAPPRNQALLEIVKSVHGERMGAYAALQARLLANTDLMAVIVEAEGFPFLYVYRVADLRVGNRGRCVRVGCVYYAETWWYVTPGAPAAGPNLVAPMSDPAAAARIIAGALLP
ncbi:hypothetical protein GCM10022214_36490 [Actinomadura miaoliensis]|uniref:Uncharacterized protein n=1 Tax=Actinomadura miaoliensis TaxID=430685 RepID=A0ABP7VWI4_9ACTN